MTLTLDAEAVARLTPTHEPVTWTIDDDGASVYIRLPAPRRLAECVSIPGAMRDGASVVRDGEALSLYDLASTLRALLVALPDRDAVYTYYGDLRTAATAKSGRMASYCLDVIRAARAGLDPVPLPAPAERAPRAPAKTGAQRVKEYRDRLRADEIASARAFLAVVRPLLAEGEQRDARDLYAAAVKNIGRRLGESISADDDSDVWAVPGRTLFYAIADEVLGDRVRRSRGFVYVIRRFIALLKEATVNALTIATEILGHGPRTAEEAEQYADARVREVLDLAASSPRPASYDDRVLALPPSLAFAIAGAEDAAVVSTFGLMGREHLRRHPEDRPEVGAFALALRAGDPDGLVPQVRAYCAERLTAEAVA